MIDSRRPLRVALTGGIATGKSHCLRRFAAAGVPVIDADALAREAVSPGSAGLRAVVARFGPIVVDRDGALDRAALGRIVFDDAAARHELETIIHPEVRKRIEGWFANLEHADAPTPFAVADVPLLFEVGWASAFDIVVVAACEPEEAVKRVMKRDSLSEPEARQRVASQLPIAEKRARADHVIETSGTVQDTDRQVDDVIKTLGLRAERE